jgi:hypothetical protein
MNTLDVWTSSEIINLPYEPPPHPRVTINMDNLTLLVHGPYAYEVDLERFTTPAQALDSILQVAGKTWCDTALVGELVNAVEHACYLNFGHEAQGVLCPFGRNTAIDWLRKKTRTIRP